MNKWLIAAAATVLASPAGAEVITLQSVTENGPSDFTFTYQGTIGPDEGLRDGDRLIVFDFSGYIEGSVSSPFPQVVASVENVSTGAILTEGFDDDPNIANLVFTFTGPDFRTEGGPFETFEWDGLSARSTFGFLRADAFFAATTKNNPDGQPGGSGSAVFSFGSVTVPNAIPEPEMWAMMIGGFGLAGWATRRRRAMTRILA